MMYIVNTKKKIFKLINDLFQTRLTAKIDCEGSKAWWPFDTKECHLHIESCELNLQQKNIIIQMIRDDKMNFEQHLNTF